MIESMGSSQQDDVNVAKVRRKVSAEEDVLSPIPFYYFCYWLWLEASALQLVSSPGLACHKTPLSRRFVRTNVAIF